MTNKQLVVFYSVFLGFGLVLTLGLYLFGKDLSPPTTALDHANKYCQALYGPQTGAIWDDHLKCQTVRGEILPAKQP